MRKLGVAKKVKRSELPKGVAASDSTWTFKKKSSGVYPGRLSARGFKQVNGVIYDSTSILVPVTNAVSVRLILILMLMVGWIVEATDVKSVFCVVNLTMEKCIHGHTWSTGRITCVWFSSSIVAYQLWSKASCHGILEGTLRNHEN